MKTSPVRNTFSVKLFTHKMRMWYNMQTASPLESTNVISYYAIILIKFEIKLINGLY